MSDGQEILLVIGSSTLYLLIGYLIYTLVSEYLKAKEKDFDEDMLAWGSTFWPITILYFILFKWVIKVALKIDEGLKWLAREFANPRNNT